MTVRARIQREVAALFEGFDFMLCPTCPTPAFKLGQKVDDPLEMYLSDLYTTFVNMARIPSLSVPAGWTKDSTDAPALPVGIQVAGPLFSEAKILRVAAAWEADNPGCGFPMGEHERSVHNGHR
jgi:aspartyl-tRNA(Asn)/glutamyl-tRNA(Gln) amidotransferase subunit A